MRKDKSRGASTIEFVLVGIPLIFILISCFEIARAMWTYQTLAHAVKDAARYASVHGSGCTSLGNSCGITVADVASRIQNGGPGLLTSQMSVTLTDAAGTTSCSLSSCLTTNTSWPSTAGATKGSSLTITATYQFPSALCLFWPGTKAQSFGAINFSAAARESVQF